MNEPVTHAPIVPPAEARRRRTALDAAERSGIREGLPPLSDFARAQGDRWVRGEINAEDGIAAIMAYHRRVTAAS